MSMGRVLRPNVSMSTPARCPCRFSNGVRSGFVMCRFPLTLQALARQSAAVVVGYRAHPAAVRHDRLIEKRAARWVVAANLVTKSANRFAHVGIDLGELHDFCG